MSRALALIPILLLGCSTPPAAWEPLETEPAQDKQDDISLVDAETGWYVNSLGKIFRTTNGADSPATWAPARSRDSAPSRRPRNSRT